jgi:hypothetical protein
LGRPIDRAFDYATMPAIHQLNYPDLAAHCRAVLWINDHPG